MSAFTDFLDTIRTWAQHKEYSDELVTSFVRIAESSLDKSLRVRDMVVTDYDLNPIDGKAQLPADFSEMETVWWVDGRGTLDPMTPGEFFSSTVTEFDYTIRGFSATFGAGVTLSGPSLVNCDYYANVPKFESDATWLFAKYYDVFLMSCLAAAALYGQEFERAQALESTVAQRVQIANDDYTRTKRSGGVLKMGKPKRG